MPLAASRLRTAFRTRYPSNPRGYFDIDLRTTASRDAYSHMAPLRACGG
jgi:hypothetical protein